VDVLEVLDVPDVVEVLVVEVVELVLDVVEGVGGGFGGLTVPEPILNPKSNTLPGVLSVIASTASYICPSDPVIRTLSGYSILYFEEHPNTNLA